MGFRLRPAIAIAVILLFSLVVSPGYEVFVSDHKFYVPEIFNSMDQELFRDDFLLSFKHASFTLFDEMTIFLISFLNIDIITIFFVLSVIVRFVYLYSIYRIALYFTGDGKFSILSVFLFFRPFMVFGTAVPTMDIFMVPRLISVALGLVFLYLYLNKRKLLSTLPLGIGLLFHPIFSVPFLAFFYLELVISFIRKRSLDHKEILSGFVPFIFLFILMGFVNDYSNLNVFRLIDPAWKDVLSLRDKFIFVTEWNPVQYLLLAASGILFIITAIELKSVLDNERMEKFSLIFLVSLLLFLVSLITVDLLDMHFFAQLQLSRGLLFWKIFVTLLFSYYAYLSMMKRNRDYLFNFSLAGLIMAFVFNEHLIFAFLPLFVFLWLNRRYRILSGRPGLMSEGFLSLIVFIPSLMASFWIFLFIGDTRLILYTFPLLIAVAILTVLVGKRKGFVFSHKAILFALSILAAGAIIMLPVFSISPEYIRDASLVEAYEWVSLNTDPGDSFLTEPFVDESGAFRCGTLRSTFITRKDGGKVVFSRDYAIEWKRRMDVASGAGRNLSLISEVARDEGIDYIFSNRSLDIPFSTAYNNSRYFVYDVNSSS